VARLACLDCERIDEQKHERAVLDRLQPEQAVVLGAHERESSAFWKSENSLLEVQRIARKNLKIAQQVGVYFENFWLCVDQLQLRHLR